MRKKIDKIKKSLLKKRLGKFFLSLLLIVGVSLASAYYYFQSTRIMPNVYVLGYKLSGKDSKQLDTFLQNEFPVPEKIYFKNDGEDYELLLSEINFKYNYDQTANALKSSKREDGFLYLVTHPLSVFEGRSVDLSYNLDDKLLNEFLLVISSQIKKDPVFPSITLDKTGIVINKGQEGYVLKTEELKSSIYSSLSRYNTNKIDLPYEKIDPSIDDAKATAAKNRAERFMGKNIELSYEYDKMTIGDQQIISLINFQGNFDQDKIIRLTQDVSAKFNRPPQNALFLIGDDKVTDFLASKDGLELDREKFKNKLDEVLKNLEKSDNISVAITLDMKITAPSVTTDEVNNLGINELLGRGYSTFTGSIPSRVHNIKLSSSKFNGVIVKPNTTASFNELLGDVSTLTGYKQAYIIKDGKTVLGDGGGVCQVSTTFFRAMLDAGLPVTERRAHSYRVSYYEQNSSPGLDATVYSPTTDLKFINDTPGHLLIQTIFDEQNYSLTFEIYGSSDGRVASTTKPVVYEVQEPPEDLYVDDPNLPEGTVKQIERKSWGAKVKFDYSVEKDGQIIYEKTFFSNYQPWQAVFLRGTKLTT